MILADSSVWIDHFRRGDSTLLSLLEDDQVLAHDSVVGELACGSLKLRAKILRLLANLPSVPTVDSQIVLELIERHRLWGRGLGWIDVHLLGAAIQTQVRLWTLDRRLAAAARELGVG